MSDERAREIAGSLSDMQKLAILHGRWIGGGDTQVFSVPCPKDPWPEGVAQFLTLHHDSLTPLGLAVRRILEEGSNGK